MTQLAAPLTPGFSDSVERAHGRDCRSFLRFPVRNWAWLILALALALRLWGINWQLPALLYPDELKYVGWAGAVADNRPPDRTDFRNPSLYRYLLFGEYRVIDTIAPIRDVRLRAERRTSMARVTSAVLGSGAAVLTGLAAAVLFSRSAGVIAGLIMAIGPLPVHLSHFAINDAPALFFLAAGLYFGARVYIRPRWQDVLLAGLAAGLATAGKYNFGVIGVLPVIGLMTGVTRQTLRPAQALGLAGVVAFAGLVGLLVAMPELVMTPAAVRDGILEQAAKGTSPSIEQEEIPVPLLYLHGTVRGLGLPVTMFALIGVARLAKTYRFLALALLAPPTLYLLVMLRSGLFAVRFALPILPFVAIIAAVAVLFVVDRWRSSSARKFALTVSLLAIVVPASLAVIEHNTLASTRDTRLLARDWLRANAGRANVAVQAYGLPNNYWGTDSSGDYEVRRFKSLESRSDANRLACNETRYVVLSNFWYERDLKQASIDGVSPTGYDWLTQHASLIQTISPFKEGQVAPQHPDDTAIPFWYMTAYARPGPRIDIWQLPDNVRSLCVSNQR